MTDEQLDELERLAGAATPNLRYDDGITDDHLDPPERGKPPIVEAIAGGHHVVVAEMYDMRGAVQMDADGRYAVAACAAVPDLVAEVRRLRALTESLAARCHGQSEILSQRAERDALARLGAWLAGSRHRRCLVEASIRVPGRMTVRLEGIDEGPVVFACGYPALASRSGEDRRYCVWLFIDTDNVSVLLAAALDEWERTHGKGGGA